LNPRGWEVRFGKSWTARVKKQSRAGVETHAKRSFGTLDELLSQEELGSMREKL
jgi:hypothetical protein